MGKFWKTTSLALFAVLMSALCGQTVLAAGSASFSLAPTNGSYAVGAAVPVVISETSSDSDTTNAVQAELSYDPALLQYESTALGAFTYCVKNKGGGGSVTIICAATSVQHGKQTVATVKFKALKAGTAHVKMTAGSQIDNTDGKSVWNGVLPAATYYLGGTAKTNGSAPTAPAGTNKQPGTADSPAKTYAKPTTTVGQAKASNNTVKYTAGVAIIVVLLGCAGYWLYNRRTRT